VSESAGDHDVSYRPPATRTSVGAIVDEYRGAVARERRQDATPQGSSRRQSGCCSISPRRSCQVIMQRRGSLLIERSEGMTGYRVRRPNSPVRRPAPLNRRGSYSPWPGRLGRPGDAGSRARLIPKMPLDEVGRARTYEVAALVPRSAALHRKSCRCHRRRSGRCDRLLWASHGITDEAPSPRFRERRSLGPLGRAHRGREVELGVTREWQMGGRRECAPGRGIARGGRTRAIRRSMSCRRFDRGDY